MELSPELAAKIRAAAESQKQLYGVYREKLYSLAQVGSEEYAKKQIDIMYQPGNMEYGKFHEYCRKNGVTDITFEELKKG